MSRKNTRKRKIRFKVNNSKMPQCLFAGKLKLRPKIAVSLLIHPGSIRRTLELLQLVASPDSSNIKRTKSMNSSCVIRYRVPS
ncbi:MAG: hypothetical protein IPM97_12740 [Bdellovibrionaceae bacterium]|nr:hypothetical protein [Pseudobdellovibrionaceae bacterium]